MNWLDKPGIYLIIPGASDTFFTFIAHLEIMILLSLFQFTVNGIEIVKQDIYTYSGVIHEINGLFSPIFNNCDNKIIEDQMVRQKLLVRENKHIRLQEVDMFSKPTECYLFTYQFI